MIPSPAFLDAKHRELKEFQKHACPRHKMRAFVKQVMWMIPSPAFLPLEAAMFPRKTKNALLLVLALQRVLYKQVMG
ncbi:MAG: hypothetical protein HY584_01715 [Candidatus Omnitrophica bacterium]|nr:hypothetical protein [Candidatus Omnitrophota bacterium]